MAVAIAVRMPMAAAATARDAFYVHACLHTGPFEFDHAKTDPKPEPFLVARDTHPPLGPHRLLPVGAKHKQHAFAFSHSSIVASDLVYLGVLFNRLKESFSVRR